MAAEKMKPSVKSASGQGVGKMDAKRKPKLSEDTIVDSDIDSVGADSDTSSEAAVLSKAGAASLAATMLNGGKGSRDERSPKTDMAFSSSASYENMDVDQSVGEEMGGVRNNEGDSGKDSDENSGDDSELEPSLPPSSSQKLSISSRKSGIEASKVSGVKRKKTSQDETVTKSGEESSSESHEESDEEDRTSKKARLTGNNDVSTSQDDMAASSEENRMTGVQTTPTMPSADPKPAQHSSLASIPIQAYVAPQGYRAVETSDRASIPMPELAGKKIWHITAPVDVPASSITSLALAAFQSGQTVLSHKDIDYVLTEVSAPEQAIFVPGAGGYKAVPQIVKKSFGLRPAFTLPSIPARAAARDAGSLAAGNIALSAVKSIRPQPKGLRMRFKPPGFGRGEPGIIGGDEADEEEIRPRSTFQFPRAVGPSTDGNAIKLADGDVQKKKKDKKNTGLAHAPNGLADQFEPQARTSTKVPTALVKVAATTSSIGETSAEDEEARRKAERRAKKAAKKKRAQEDAS